jgi:hypothetical protein
MDLVELVLVHFRETLARLREEAIHHDKHLGEPPLYFVVEQREPAEHRVLNVGRAIRRWKVDSTGATEIGLEEPIPEPNRSGMYYDIGRGNFAVLQDLQRVRVGWGVGPRYARGYEFPIEHDESGTTHFGPWRNLWFS